MASGRRLTVATVFGLLFVMLAWGYSEAQSQLPAANAEVKVVRGRAEVLKKGQASWATLAQNARLTEGDQIRTGPGASIEFALPDGSNTLVAENTRYVITKLQYDAKSRERNFGFHLVAGKVKSDVARAAVTAVRARQANYFVSSPNGVAAVRGTVLVLLFNPATGQTLAAVFPSPGQPPASAVVTFISLSTGTVTSITGGNFVTLVPGQPPSAPARVTTLPPAIQTILLTATNTATAGSPLLVAVEVEIPAVPPILTGGDTGTGGTTDTTAPTPPPTAPTPS